MASRSAPPCTHELRPGITVCLRCQHAERAAHIGRQRNMIVRGVAVTLGLAVVAAVGIAAASAFRFRGPSPKVSDKADASSAPADLPTTSPSLAVAEVAVADSEMPPPAGRTAVNDTIARLGVPKSSALSAASPVVSTSHGIALTVPVGRTALRDTMVADRSGDTVRVSFDLLLSRTRRSDKFEAIVRSTLPQVYGAIADSALRALPAGAVARAGDLVTTLPERGFRIPLADGRAIAVWPETRVGRDGPLVVAYRAVGSR
jgi:hypothetical protein